LCAHLPIASAATRNGRLSNPAPPPAERLAQGVEAAHKDDCMKGQFFGGDAGLLSLPFLVAAEAMGKCAHK